MEGILDVLASASFWAAAIRIATPLMFGVLGALLCERAGVLNLGIEGIFTAGAMAGWLTVYAGGGLWSGVLVAALTGAAFGFILGVLTVPLGLSQHVAGIGVTLFATSLAYFTYRVALPNVSTPPRIAPFRPLDVPGSRTSLPRARPVPADATHLPRAGPLRLAAFVLVRTPLGLAIRAAGRTRRPWRRRGSTSTRSASAPVVGGAPRSWRSAAPSSPCRPSTPSSSR
jgi:simple sugar transport system permease protein